VAIYVPASKRRRNTIIIAVIALLVGLGPGLIAGRASAPSLGEQVADVQEQARTATSQLRVVALHEDAKTGSEGTDLALRRARDELDKALDDAPWITDADAKALRTEVDRLTTTSSADDIEKAARDIEVAFGIAE
jgi:hypothetical protein